MPIGNVEPDNGVHVTGIVPSTLSVAVAVYVTTAPLGLVASTVMSAGRIRVGRGSTRTAMVKLPVDETPNAFVAVREHAYVLPVVSPLIVSGLAVAVACPGAPPSDDSHDPL